MTRTVKNIFLSIFWVILGIFAWHSIILSKLTDDMEAMLRRETYYEEYYVHASPNYITNKITIEFKVDGEAKEAPFITNLALGFANRVSVSVGRKLTKHLQKKSMNSFDLYSVIIPIKVDMNFALEL
jgi:hypothetical protein